MTEKIKWRQLFETTDEMHGKEGTTMKWAMNKHISTEITQKKKR